MKTKILLFITVLTMSFVANAQIDRSKMPKPGPDPVIKLKKTRKFTLKNGLTVIMVENHKLPRVSASLTIDNKPYVEGDKAGVSSLMGSLLGRGTSNITKDEFNEKVDFIGASINFFSSGASARSLSRYFPEVLKLMADGVKNSEFTKEEFEKEVKVTLENLKSGEKDASTIARRVESVLNYGKNHPYGEFTTKETVNNISLEDVENNYKTYYRPNNAYLVIIGDINPRKTKKLVKKLFGNWEKGNIPNNEITKPTNVDHTEINFVNMPNAVQSEITVINNINLKVGDKDYYAALLANKILGGGGSARLFNNLREDKGYTYGSYSSIRANRYAASFRANASVRNMVTDSSVVEILKEVNKIRYKGVTKEELKNAKEEYIGGFVMDVQKPNTAASFALNIARFNLPDDYYENYIKNINSVTLEDVKKASLKYFKGDKARVIITGKGNDVLDNLEKVGYPINYFDKEGNPTEKPEMTIPIPKGLTATKVINKYIDAIGGKDKIMEVNSIFMVANATIQGTPLVLTSKSALPNKSSQVVSVMGQVFQKSVFDGKKGYTEARGQRKDMAGKELETARAKTSLFEDLGYTDGKLLRVEPIDGKKAIVLQHMDKEIFYDLNSGLKIKEVKTVKLANGKEMKMPTIFSDYKEVNGVKFPYKIDQKNGPMMLNFVVKELKINEGVTDKDFE
ncbi:M16 family metallopeptidase [Polaribacter septentrionalilitoris]|uniref:M16 family metallopeptidase n=1 Tax=Polaribacter septentrionalilitoris TaxID=2494657 RepID=UPI00135986FE|nr:pitrilysin family protein [Polaribacter septentrionalilitoris]